MKKIIWKLLTVLLTALVLFYLMLPSLNIHDYKFYFFILILLIEILVLSLPGSIVEAKTRGIGYFFKSSSASLITKITLGLMLVSFIYVFGTAIVYSPMFKADTYSKRIEVKNVDFSEVPTYNFNTTAIIDRSSASLLGDKVMGNMTDLVSQFVVSSEYSQISYQEGTYRVTPLAYDGLIKYFKNSSKTISQV